MMTVGLRAGVRISLQVLDLERTWDLSGVLGRCPAICSMTYGSLDSKEGEFQPSFLLVVIVRA